MSETLYIKVGRRYHPVREYSPEMMDSLPSGYHLVAVMPGCKSIRYDINPEAAPLLAALVGIKEDLVKLVQDLSTWKRTERKIQSARDRAKCKKAFEAWTQLAPPGELLGLNQASAWSIVDALEKRLIEECGE